MSESYKLGITKPFACNYLEDKEERLLVAVDEELHNTEKYGWLMSEGFRRSGDQIYRPHCVACSACKSIRVLTENFRPSKSQKRCINKNQHFNVTVSYENKAEYYALYQQYVDTVHQDGAMFPANKEQYQSFANSNVVKQLYVEIWHEEKLISVAVTDLLPSALSAVYTFYDPNYRQYAIGVFSILKQIEIAGAMGKPYLYLGYQIDQCQKMNYKNKYFPYQELVENRWNTVKK